MTRSSLHVSNIANVAYGYCRILAEANQEVALRCHDLHHLMSQPEWEDLELFADDFPNEADFRDNTADFGDYSRPAWFQSESVLQVTNQSLAPDEEAAQPTLAMRAFLGAVNIARKVLPLSVKTRLYPAMTWIRLMQMRSVPGAETYLQYREELKQRNRLLREIAGQYGREWAVSNSMLARFEPHAWWLHTYQRNYDTVFGYALAPIYAMMEGNRPWVSVEIGTMREIPFDGTDIGRMLALAYRLSPHVLITNPDVKVQADELGVKSYEFCPHPLDEDLLRPSEGPSELREQLKRDHNADFLFFAPARQNWAVKGNDRYLRAFAALLSDGVRACLLIPGWGQEVKRSQKLCQKLGIEDRVVWLRPQSERVLLKYYQACDLVLDQFILGVFGLTTPKAMSCGAVVLTSYDRPVHEWCFSEHPPLVACSTEKEIYQAMKELCENEQQRRELSQRAREWICTWHSKAVVRRILDRASDTACRNFES